MKKISLQEDFGANVFKYNNMIYTLTGKHLFF